MKLHIFNDLNGNFLKKDITFLTLLKIKIISRCILKKMNLNVFRLVPDGNECTNTFFKHKHCISETILK